MITYKGVLFVKKFTAVFLSVIFILCSCSLWAFAETEKPFYLVLGDSIAYGSGVANAKEACYGKIVADTNGYEYANFAIPGHTTTNLIKRLSEKEVIEAVEKADIISISIGGNDFLMSNLVGLMFDSMVLGNHAKYDEIAEGFYANFSKIMDIINEHNADAVVLMQTLYNPQSGYLRQPYQEGADRLNAAIYRYNEEHPGEIVIVDVGTALGDNPENYAGDDIHPSVKGNEIIAKVILEKLYELKLGTTTESVISVKGQDVQIPEMFTAFFNVYGTIFHVVSVIYNFFAGIFTA